MIELVIVIVVIGLLAAMTLPKMIVFTSVGDTNVKAYQDVAGQAVSACIETAISAGKTGSQITALCGAETSATASVVATSYTVK
ncbi:MAG: hypothetical protein G8345_10875 [Magnetococcales bacterium]|nr:hypothetical protein [Magnetococcales bacterium]NGZ27375.1 hypothetical protein [Magnetococcales bacterium]